MTTRFNVKCNIYVQQVIKDKQGCRRFYDIMISSFKLEAQNKWLQKLGFITDRELKAYNMEIKSIKEVKLKDFRHLQRGIQEFHRKFVLVPANKAQTTLLLFFKNGN